MSATLINISAMFMLVAGVEQRGLGMSMASDDQLASVWGSEVLYFCCEEHGGQTCSWTPPAGSTERCWALLYPQQCEALGGGNACYFVSLGPSGNATCAQTSNPDDLCLLQTDGWCVEYRAGTCVQHYNILMEPTGCTCDGLGSAQHSGTRTYCGVGSHLCGGGIVTPPKPVP